MKNFENNIKNKVGFMQGRLSPKVNGRIQSFPTNFWEDEFALAQLNDFHLMEWTIDYDSNDLYNNPLLSHEGVVKIHSLCQKFSVHIPSLTGDCFMQKPFWKSEKSQRDALFDDFFNIINAAAKIGIKYIVIPLVDNGKIESHSQEQILIKALSTLDDFYVKNNLYILFESDLNPSSLSKFINPLNPKIYGVNYDVGNSASLGYQPKNEILAYGNRIHNVHIKDRLQGGSTVELGAGNANFKDVFDCLHKINYQGNYILQTARAHDDNHVSVLCRYRDMVCDWIKTSI